MTFWEIIAIGTLIYFFVIRPIELLHKRLNKINDLLDELRWDINNIKHEVVPGSLEIDLDETN